MLATPKPVHRTPEPRPSRTKQSVTHPCAAPPQVIGERLHCVFVDNGLLRLDEGARVMKTFAEQLHLPVTKVDARASMMARLKGVTDPEAKRKAIGAEFIDCFKRFRCALCVLWGSFCVLRVL